VKTMAKSAIATCLMALALRSGSSIEAESQLREPGNERLEGLMAFSISTVPSPQPQ